MTGVVVGKHIFFDTILSIYFTTSYQLKFVSVVESFYPLQLCSNAELV